MKTRLLVFLGMVVNCAAFAQGLINFGNNSATLISHIAGGAPSSPIPPVANSYYFGLFTAPPNTMDRSVFTFSGNYATNLAVAGRIFGGTSAVVNGWAAGTSRAIMVYGWSADLGNLWNNAWLSGFFPGATANSQFGFSQICPNLFVGGFDGTATWPNPVVFSSTGIPTGFVLGIPEPTSFVLAGFGAAILVAVRRKHLRLSR